MKTATQLLKWYRQHGRVLPWRKTRDPYRILVSEIMLQQTQVERVKIYYESWLKKFPTWKILAKASNAQVIHAWSGLGYNRRALILRDIARVIIRDGIPQSQESWLAIKGIGPYTSAALSAFAQKKRILPIDTNIRRVLGRALLGKTFPQFKDDQKIREYANTFLPRTGAYFDVPQALFDLSSLICTKNPSCAVCPLRLHCKAAKKFLSGTVKIPRRTILVSHEHRHRNKPYPDRIYRGRILKLIKERGQVGFRALGPQIDPMFDKKLDSKWLINMIVRLTQDELVTIKKDFLQLSGKK